MELEQPLLPYSKDDIILEIKRERPLAENFDLNDDNATQNLYGIIKTKYQSINKFYLLFLQEGDTLKIKSGLLGSCHIDHVRMPDTIDIPIVRMLLPIFKPF